MKDNKAYQLGYQNLIFEDKLRKYRMKYLVDYLSTIKASKILEVGCGNDPIFLNYDNFEVMDIVEPGELFYEFTKNKIAGDQRISIQNCLLEESKLELKNDYDVIVLGGFLHEIENPEEVLSVVKKIAKPETIVLTYVPNANSFHRLLAFESGIIKSHFEFSENDKIFGRTCVFTTESVGKLFTNSGFEVVKKETYFIKPFTHQQMDDLLNLPFFTKEILQGLFRMTKYMPDMGCEIFVSARVAY